MTIILVIIFTAIVAFLTVFVTRKRNDISKSVTSRKYIFGSLVYSSLGFTLASLILLTRFGLILNNFAPGFNGDLLFQPYMMQCMPIVLLYVFSLVFFFGTGLPLFRDGKSPNSAIFGHLGTTIVVALINTWFIMVMIGAWTAISAVAQNDYVYRTLFWDDQSINLALPIFIAGAGAFYVAFSWIPCWHQIRALKDKSPEICSVCQQKISSLPFSSSRKCIACEQKVCKQCFSTNLCKPDKDRLNSEQKALVLRWDRWRGVIWRIIYVVLYLGSFIILLTSSSNIGTLLIEEIDWLLISVPLSIVVVLGNKFIKQKIKVIVVNSWAS